MLAAIATAVPFPCLSLISFATASQTSAWREEITTLAPCSAIRSATARPMPRVEPVMTATFPFMSNRLICSSRIVLCFKPRTWWRDPSTQLGDFGSRRLMHCGVLLVGDPGLLVDERQPLVRLAAGCVVIEPRHRAMVGVEGQPLLHEAAERKTDRGLDGAAMADGDDVPARLLAGDAIDRRCGAVIKVHKTLAAGRGLIDIGEPDGAGRTRSDERRAIHALPSPEILLGESGFLWQLVWPWKTRIPDRLRGL